MRLAGCVSQAFVLLSEMNSVINNLHITAQDAKFAQNLGVQVLSDTTVFDGSDSFSSTINR